jgi:hypothetical protein
MPEQAWNYDCLTNYIKKHPQARFCYRDLKDFLDRLDRQTLFEYSQRYSESTIPVFVAEAKKPQAGGDMSIKLLASTSLLAMKMNLLSYTHPDSCAASSLVCEPSPYSCFAAAQNALMTLAKNEDDWIMAEMALVVAQFLLRKRRGGYESPGILALLQATAVLEKQHKITPSDQTVVLVLTRLHILLGNVPRAAALWKKLQVKRALIDSVGPLFFDQITTVYPCADRLPGIDKFLTQPQWRLSNVIHTALSAGNLEAAAACMDYIQASDRKFARIMTLAEINRLCRLGTWKVLDPVPTTSRTPPPFHLHAYSSLPVCAQFTDETIIYT